MVPTRLAAAMTIVVAIVLLIDGEFIIGMLRHAPPHLAALRTLAIPAALLIIGVKLWLTVQRSRGRSIPRPVMPLGRSTPLTAR